MEKFKGPRWFFYNFSSIGHALFDSLLLTYHLDFLLPPAENKMLQFIPEKLGGVIPVVGFLMIIGRLVDAVADPLIASRSDRSRSKIGRRRLFLLIGGLPLGLSTMLIFFPPVQATSWLNVIYLGFMFSFFFLFYTIYVAPYIALIPELGHTEKERLNMTAAQAIFALIGGILALIGGPNLLKVFAHMGTLRAYQTMIVILSLAGIIFLYTAVLAVDEKRFTNSKPSAVPLKQSILITLKNKDFMIFLAANMCFWYVFNVIRSSALHIGQTMMLVSREEAGDNFIILFAVAFAGFVLSWLLARVIGKKTLMLIGLGSFALLSLLIALTGLLPGDPNIYGKIVFGLFGIPVSILLVIPNVFISELCDYDFRATGERREAMYFGVHGFFAKANLGLSTLITSGLFVFFGKDLANPTGVRLSTIVAAVVALIGLLVFTRYREKAVKEPAV